MFLAKYIKMEMGEKIQFSDKQRYTLWKYVCVRKFVSCCCKMFRITMMLFSPNPITTTSVRLSTPRCPRKSLSFFSIDEVATGFSCAENHFLCSPCLFLNVQYATESVLKGEKISKRGQCAHFGWNVGLKNNRVVKETFLPCMYVYGHW